jgi:hypothetical protein
MEIPWQWEFPCSGGARITSVTSTIDGAHDPKYICAVLEGLEQRFLCTCDGKKTHIDTQTYWRLRRTSPHSKATHT